MDINKLTLELLDIGYTEHDTPPGMKPYNHFYGGFTYTCKTLYAMVFETPCGLLVQGGHFTGGMMSWMGIDWMPENDNPTVCCPRFGQEPCMLNHELLRGKYTLLEKIVSCACHKTNRVYDYEHSLDKAHDEVQREADKLFEAFSHKKHGRVCRQHCHYNRATKEWSMDYDPMNICTYDCGFCTILQKELSSKKGNVFYDVKEKRTVKGVGLFPDEVKTYITKGKKLLSRTRSLTICEAIAKREQQIYNCEKLKHRLDTFSDPTYSFEVLNIRAERRESRDLLQDLQDAAEGITVSHSNDIIKQTAQQKRERKVKAKERKNKRLERLILENGFDGLQDIDKIRTEKYLDSDRVCELEEMHRNRYEQITF